MKRTMGFILSVLILITVLTGCNNRSNNDNFVLADGDDTETLSVESVQKPIVDGLLPEEFKRSEYDDQYFKPDSDDYIVITYEQPVIIYTPVWYVNRTGVYEYGPYRDENSIKSKVWVTYILSFDGETPISTKIRAEYKSIEEAMYAGLVYDFNICPTALGHANEPNDELVTEGYFEEADKMLYERLLDAETDTLEVNYLGHFDNFRYFEFNRQESSLKYLDTVPLCDKGLTLAYMPFISLNSRAGESLEQSITSFNENYTLTIYSSKKTYEAGSDSLVLDAMYKLTGDKDYFSPITDDYAFVIESNSTYDYGNGISDYMQETFLYSFDTDGNLVQCIKRVYNSYFKQEGFDYKSYFPDYSEEDWSHTVYDEADKVFYIDYLTLYGMDCIDSRDGLTAKQSLERELTEEGQHEGYYLSIN